MFIVRTEYFAHRKGFPQKKTSQHHKLRDIHKNFFRVISREFLLVRNPLLFTESSVEAMVPSMNTPYLTLAEASAKTGRSLSTVRRLIHSISKDQHHPERDAVIPTHEEAEALKKKGENFTWRIRQDIVDREFGSAPSKKEKVQSELSSDVLGMLQKELDMKNQQIEKQWEVIGSLNERLREGNILMASLQKRLALPEVASVTPSTVEVTSTEPSVTTSKKASTSSTRSVGEKAAQQKVAREAAKEAEKVVKKKMFSWLWEPIGTAKK